MENVPSIRNDKSSEQSIDRIHKYLIGLKQELEYNLQMLSQDTKKATIDLSGLFDGVADTIDKNKEYWDRIKEITDGLGNVIAEKLQGNINTAIANIMNGTSTVEFNEIGIYIHDQPSEDESTWAMMLSAQGIMIADGKIENPTNQTWSWNWRTFGTGKGFTADDITTGKLSAITLEACNILASNITSGTLRSVTIETALLNGNEINGGTITGSEIIGNTIKGNTIEGGTITGTDIIGTNITGANISTGSFNATNMQVSGLVVGNNVTMGPNATIAWNNITDNQNVITIANIANHAMIDLPEDVVKAADLVWEKLSNKPQDLVTFTDLLWEKIIGAPDIPSVALQAIKSTYIDGNGVWTPSVYATRINTLYGKISTALIENLVVGSNVTMGPYASISWANVTSKPNIPTTDSYGQIDWSIIKNKPNTTYIDSSGVYTGTVAANNIVGEFILSEYSKVEKLLKIANGSSSGLELRGYYGRGEIDFFTGGSSTGCKVGYVNGTSTFEIYCYYGTSISLYSPSKISLSSGSNTDIYSSSAMTIKTGSSLDITSSSTMNIKASGSSVNIDGSTIDARGTSYGYFGTSNAYVYGTGYSLKLNASSGTSTTGNLSVSGTISATGAKPATVLTENYGYRQLFSEEADKIYFSTKGLADTKLTTDEKYQYIIRLDPVFLQTIEVNSTDPYLVYVTPYSNAHIWVKQVYDQYIIIESDKETKFAYDVKCIRKNYRDYYLREVDFRNGEV